MCGSLEAATVERVALFDLLFQLSHQVFLIGDIATDGAPRYVVAAKRHQDPAVYAVTDKPVAVLGKLTVRAVTEQSAKRALALDDEVHALVRILRMRVKRVALADSGGCTGGSNVVYLVGRQGISTAQRQAGQVAIDDCLQGRDVVLVLLNTTV